MPEFVVEFGKGGTPGPQSDGRLDAPAFHRNHAAIWNVIGPRLRDRSGDVLEVGSGTGQHVVAFARQSPHLLWWPSDYNEVHLASIEAWRAHAGLGNIRAARLIDLAAPDWGLDAADSARLRGLTAIFCANVVHIAPWAVAEGLLSHAAARLQREGELYLYGPFKRDGAHTAASNAAFDTSLRAQNAAWGVRDTADLSALASASGLRLADTVEMPANNLILIFARVLARGD